MRSATLAMAASPPVTTELLMKLPPPAGRDHSDPRFRVKSRLKAQPPPKKTAADSSTASPIPIRCRIRASCPGYGAAKRPILQRNRQNVTCHCFYQRKHQEAFYLVVPAISMRASVTAWGSG